MAEDLRTILWLLRNIIEEDKSPLQDGVQAWWDKLPKESKAEITALYKDVKVEEIDRRIVSLTEEKAVVTAASIAPKEEPIIER